MSHLLSAVLGLSLAAGLNAYLTVVTLGVLQRTGVLDLPDGLKIVAATPVLLAASLLCIVEFFADKIPYVDTVWDAIHTVVRPAAGALLSYAAVGAVDPQWQVIAALVGGGVALTSHTAKASTRAAANLSPEPVSNWILSLTEDAVSIALVWLTVTHPLIAIAAALILMAGALYLIWKFSALCRRLFRRITT
jgi:hypothetical protein